MTNVRRIEMLLVEDNPGDARLVQETLEFAKKGNGLSIAKDGEEALNILRREGRFANVPIPELILLDLNLPKKNGCEVLAEIQNDAELRLIPVVVFSTSQAEDDIRKVYELNGNCYLTKPVDLEEYMTVIHSLETFWFGIARLPSKATK